MASLSLEQKVGQLLMTHFRGEVANADAKTLIEEIQVGGIIYYEWANGLTSPKQVKNLSESLQKLSQIPLLIAADQEGGRVTTLKQGFTLFPGNKALAESGQPALAKEQAFIAGQELKGCGLNINFAPVVDMHQGDRSFGTCKSCVISFAEQAISGFQEAGLLTTLKHFPGLGQTTIDSHLDLPVKKDYREDIYPFQKLGKRSDAIMTAHVLVTDLDPENCATLSKKVLDLLSDYEGAIITDSLVMQGVLKQAKTLEEAAIRALIAGCDILLISGRSPEEPTVNDIRRVHQALVDAVNSGRVPQERLDSALSKIQRLKEKICK